MLLEDLSDDWDSGVNRVGDNEDECLGSSLSDSISKIADNSSIDLKNPIMQPIAIVRLTKSIEMGQCDGVNAYLEEIISSLYPHTHRNRIVRNTVVLGNDSWCELYSPGHL